MTSEKDIDYLLNMPYIDLKQLNDTIAKRERAWASLPATMTKGYPPSIAVALTEYNALVKKVYEQRTEDNNGR